MTTVTAEVTPAHSSTRGGRLLAAARHAAPALAGYAAIKVFGVLTIVVWGLAVDRQPAQLLAKADGGWYLRIAQHGYDMGERLQSDMAFFPLYPGLIAALDPLTPLSPRGTALVIGWLASLAAAWGIFAIGDHLFDRRTGVLLALVWGALPHAIVQSMAYTEGLFTAFTAWTLLALLRRQWLTAGVLCLLAGLTRPTATALIAVVGLAALIAAVRRRDGWRPIAAMLLAPAGWAGYLAWVGWVTGRLDGWFHIQREGWNMAFDAGASTLERGSSLLFANASALDYYVVTLVIVLAVMLLVLCLLDRQPWQLVLFSALLLANTVAAAGYYHAKARFLLPAFPLLLPVAVALARTGRAKAGTIVATLVLISVYLGGYLLVIWTHSP
ncbi:hypothetical protein ACN28C_26635 [Plantactinospora sp. WMMC1484]|uniref:hypothetical protein n=1 Tax=Plantactinospora sp. WMMC1484 TaxID=3404122 RepID=UPI003BF495F1